MRREAVLAAKTIIEKGVLSRLGRKFQRTIHGHDQDRSK